jgi:hypothetical protein
MLFAVVGALFLLPVALARYPPILDLAQQMGQIPLAERALGPEAATYRIAWTAPNKISYPLLALGWWTGGAEYGPRIGLALCLLGALGAIHFLAATLDRPLWNAALASIFVFSSSFYGGFFNFVLGGWALALWLRELSGRGDEADRLRVAVRASLIGLLCYWSHALWLLAAMGLLFVGALVRPAARRLIWIRGGALVPFLAMFWLWNLSTVGDTRQAGVVRYEIPMSSRLIAPRAWSEQLLGGIRGLFEPITLGLLLVWAFAAFWRSRREKSAGLDRLLILAAGAFFAAAIVLPDTMAETWLFARRWAMWGGSCLVLALPATNVERRTATAVAVAFAGAFAVITAGFWVGFDRGTMDGFDTCRAAVPSGRRLLYLDFQQDHERFFVYPTLQMAAYAALDRQVDLNFTFAEHRSSLVVRRQLPRQIPWTLRLEHFPTRVVPSDFNYFDVVLLHLPPWAIADVARKFPRLVPLTPPGEWWLLAVSPAAKVGTSAVPPG